MFGEISPRMLRRDDKREGCEKGRCSAAPRSDPVFSTEEHTRAIVAGSKSVTDFAASFRRAPQEVSVDIFCCSSGTV